MLQSSSQISGNISADCSRSGNTVRVQTGGKEELVHVTDALEERIREYIKGAKKTPKRIVYLRDGVGDSQAARVSPSPPRSTTQMLQEEWACLVDAVRRQRLQPEPYLVFVMAQKSHNLRMFDQAGERGNVRMGTVLAGASGMTSDDMNDFFVVAHRALQGTAKPLRYVLLQHGWADPARTDAPPCEVTERGFLPISRLNPVAEALIRELIPLHQMNPRAQKACMLPAPIKNAHLGAERASIHIADKWGADSDPAAADATVRVHENTKTAMYWM